MKDILQEYCARENLAFKIVLIVDSAIALIILQQSRFLWAHRSGVYPSKIIITEWYWHLRPVIWRKSLVHWWRLWMIKTWVKNFWKSFTVRDACSWNMGCNYTFVYERHLEKCALAWCMIVKGSVLLRIWIKWEKKLYNWQM